MRTRDRHSILREACSSTKSVSFDLAGLEQRVSGERGPRALEAFAHGGRREAEHRPDLLRRQGVPVGQAGDLPVGFGKHGDGCAQPLGVIVGRGGRTGWSELRAEFGTKPVRGGQPPPVPAPVVGQFEPGDPNHPRERLTRIARRRVVLTPDDQEGLLEDIGRVRRWGRSAAQDRDHARPARPDQRLDVCVDIGVVLPLLSPQGVRSRPNCDRWRRTRTTGRFALDVR